MAMLKKGEWVWVPSDIGVPIGARVKVTPSGQRSLVDDEGKEQILFAELEANVKMMHPTSVEGVDDMIKLGDMTEAGLLRNLLLRHKQGIIYTYVGSVLVAVNPYQNFPLYTALQIKLYQGRKLGELPPHIFAIAEACHFNMKRHLRNQCCIISGESGAGKTESTKLILRYLAAVSGQLSEQAIERQILESNPILEAFGNAKTVRNDNSSRFGKYLQIFFSKDGVIEGARVEQYLLEKSRVCHQALEERSYHIFYCMLAGLTEEEKAALSLRDAKEYTFLTKGGCVQCEGRDDAEDYKCISAAMKILTFSERQCQDVVKLLAAILHLGNVNFEANTQNNLDTCDVSKSKHFGVAASLLEVQKSSLANSLTHRSFMTNRERVTKPLSSEQASNCRDAVVKAIYNKLFIWIVEKINSVIYKKLHTSPKSTFLSIGLLDIFGFENFNTNSFEQLCINFANEKLQQFFVGHIFKLEQKEYLKENIVWSNINFSDNQNILDLLAVKPCNLLALIDEESNFPKGSDNTLLNKMNKQHSGSKLYISSRSEHDTDFGICHFAGRVYYNSHGFLEKNRDAVSFDVIKMVETSNNKLLRLIFESELPVNGVKVTNNSRVTMTPKNSLRGQTDGRKQVQTLSGHFRQSLESLMKALSACQPYFIRCFKPNNDKQSESFDRELCMRQLRYSGMIDTIRIRKLGFPIRHTFEEFLKRYRVLLKTTVCDPKTETAAACCHAICRAVIKEEDEWKIGKTKVFLKDAHDAILERLREQELSKVARVIQRVMLGIKDRKLFLKKRRAAVVLQKNWRAHLQAKARRKVQLGFERLLATIRRRQLQKKYKRQRAAAIAIQAQVRGYQARKQYNQKRQAALVKQAYVREYLVKSPADKRNEERYPPTQALVLPQEREDFEEIAQKLQQHLKVLDDAVDGEISDRESDQESVDRVELETTRVVKVDERIVQEAGRAERDVSKSEDNISVRTLDPGSVGPAPLVISSSPTPSVEEEEEEEDDDDFDDSRDPFSFDKFCSLYFQGNASSSHITYRLKQPLLAHDDEGDALACLTVWWIILRFMGDHPDSKSQDSVSQASSTITRNLPHRQGRRLSSLVGLDQKLLRRNNKKKQGTGARKASVIPEEPEDVTDDVLIGEGPTLDRPLSALEKAHIIIGYALSKPGIRDEIYCQICKQLVNNKNSHSRQQGWILLSICLGIFPPTDFFLKYLESFVRKGPYGYKEYCSRRLRRIKANGERKEMTCWIELEAAKSKKLIDASVMLMNNETVSLTMDSVSTSAEVCQAVATKLNLRDTYGFSLYITFYEKVWSLGSCGTHVLDAVSQCEQEMRRQDKEEKNTPWELSFRKELFTPWHDCSLDPVSTDLIYEQIIKGIKSGEYTSEKEDDYVQMAVQHYYIQFGLEYNKDNAQKVVEDCIATTLIENKSMSKWIQLISAGHSQALNATGRQSPDTIKGELVDNARQKWPLYFSKFFEVTMLSGPPLAKSRFVAAVNWSGILFMDGRDKRLLEILYLEVKDAFIKNEGYFSAQSVTLTTVRGEFVLRCTDAEEMTALIKTNLEGLKERSEFALVLSDTSKPEDPNQLVCKRGDLLLIRKNERPPHGNMFIATNQRTRDTGAVYKSVLQFLPTLSMPSDEQQELLSPSHGRTSISTPQNVQETVVPVSIKEFALENFRPPGKDANRHGVYRGGREKLWICSREPLKQPLLKALAHNSDLSYLACNAFTAILKYMGDYPIKQIRSPLDLTDQIFGPATQHIALQDEIYCQIMKQMTSNNNRLSMARGWQLMWLCTGLFAPSPNLRIYVKRFLESRPRDPLAAECLYRLQGMFSKEPRKLPPHFVEVDAIQQDSTQIFHNIHFPNETEEIFEVSSTTTIKDLCQSIATQLKLISADGYGLYFKTANKPIESLDEQKYFFDSLRESSDTPKKVKRVKDGNQAHLVYLVIIKRKLWFNVSPGKDLIADLTFHFPQELPKYLQGYHDCTKEDMIKLAGLLFRVQVDSDRSQFVMIPRMLKDLVPVDQIEIMPPEEWKKHIISSYNQQSGSTVQEAKIAFLRAISSWPTFGCSFFEVKQTCESSYPTHLRIVISKQGVSLVDPTTKEVLIMHMFSRITEWRRKGDRFQMTIGTLLRGVTFVCETPKSDTMADLVQSYVNMYNEQKQKWQVQPKNHMFSLKQ